VLMRVHETGLLCAITVFSKPPHSYSQAFLQDPIFYGFWIPINGLLAAVQFLR